MHVDHQDTDHVSNDLKLAIDFENSEATLAVEEFKSSQLSCIHTWLNT